jgi:hypothetical protein
VSEVLRYESALDDSFADAPVFYVTYCLLVVVGTAACSFGSTARADLVPDTGPDPRCSFCVARFPSRSGARPGRDGRLRERQNSSVLPVAAISMIALCVAALASLASSVDWRETMRYYAPARTIWYSRARDKIQIGEPTLGCSIP